MLKNKALIINFKLCLLNVVIRGHSFVIVLFYLLSFYKNNISL